MFCIFTLFNVEWEGMRRRIKPIVVYVVLALLGLALVIANIHNTSKQQAHLEKVKSAIPSATTPKTTTSSRSDSSDEELILNPIIDLSGWQLPQDIDYDVLSNYISGAIIRVFGGSQISKVMPPAQMELTNLLKHISKNSKNVTFQLPSIPTPKVLLSKR